MNESNESSVQKIALVTGGSGGIGGAICKELAEQNFAVAVHYHSGIDEANEVVSQIKDNGGNALAVNADLTDASSVTAMFDAVESHLGSTNVVVNNAGVDGDRGLHWEIELDDWWKTVEINLKGTFAVARHATKQMMKSKSGVIVNISSVHEAIPWGGYSAYASAKAATEMLTRTMALEVAFYGIRVVGIAPGAIKTPINKDVWSDENSLADLHAKIPMQRMGAVEDIASAVAFLVSEKANYITGSTLTVDGGMKLYADFRHGG